MKVYNEDPCYFDDGIRKIDFILVYKKEMIEDSEGNTKIRNFVLSLEEFGLEMEGENASVIFSFNERVDDEIIVLRWMKV